MVVFNDNLLFIYLIVAGLFFCGFILRALKLYPGKPEPLTLDFLGMVIALLFSQLAKFLHGSPFRFFLIFTSSLIIFPHLIYITFNEKRL